MAEASHFSPEFRGRLEQEYGPDIATQLDDWHQTPLLHAPTEHINYVTLGAELPDTNKRHVLYIGGHLAGIVAGSAFGGEMAKRGFNVTIPDQQRGEMATRYIFPNPTYTQALNVAAAIEHAGMSQEGIDFITHSYGSLILNVLRGIAEQRDWKIFRDAHIAMLSPAGVRREETVWAFLQRYKTFRQAGKPVTAPDSWYTHLKEINEAGGVFDLTNPRRAKWEGLHIVSKRVNFKKLFASGVADIGVFLHADDRLYPPEIFTNTIERNKLSNLTFTVVRGEVPEGEDAPRYEVSHSDQQIHPKNDAAAVTRFLTR